MAQDPSHLIWIDLEMTGLDPDRDLIIEIATIVTDKDLNIVAQGPVLAVHQSDAALAAMDEWNQHHHGQSGLIERVKASAINDAEAERQTLEFLKQWVPENTSPICGNSIGQDRRFLYRYMPKLEAYSITAISMSQRLKSWPPDGRPTSKTALQKSPRIRPWTILSNPLKSCVITASTSSGSSL